MAEQLCKLPPVYIQLLNVPPVQVSLPPPRISSTTPRRRTESNDSTNVLAGG